MKKGMLFFLFFATQFPSGVYAEQDWGVSLYYGAGVTKNHFPTFNKFANTYNTYSSGVIKNNLQPFGLMETHEFALSCFLFSLTYSQVTSQTIAEFINGDKRAFELSRYLGGFEMNIPFYKGNASMIEGHLGASMGNAVINSYYIYPGNVISYGGEKLWNGSYSSFNTNMYFGLKYKYMFSEFNFGSEKVNKVLNRLSVFVKGDYMLDIFGKFYFRDHNPPRYLNYYNRHPDTLPTDVVAYQKDPYNYNTNADLDNDYVVDKMDGFRILFGLGFTLFSID